MSAASNHLSLMRAAPAAFTRIADNEVFSINPDGTYSRERMQRDFPASLQHAWDLDALVALASGASASFKEGRPHRDGVSERQVLANARRERLHSGLLTLAGWCVSRAAASCNSETTLTMLEKKAAELRGKVLRAGCAALDDACAQKDRL